MGGANTAETPKANWVTEKKTPQALGDTQFHQDPQLLKQYKDLLTTGQQNISLGEIISPYYGGEEAMQSEVEKAKAYAVQRQTGTPESNLGMKMDYEKIAEKIPVSSVENSASYYSPADKQAVVQEPIAAATSTGKILEMGMSPDAEKQNTFQNFLYKNLYTKEDLQKRFENPVSDFLGTVEHEVGHNVATGKQVGEKLLGATHMDKPDELANQLGRIQREAFYLYGKRFTPEELEDFISQQKAIPENERFQNFSPDTRRGLRKLMDVYKASRISRPDLKDWEEIKQTIPEFVMNKPKSSYDAIENGLTESEKTI
jgi:hypothetical protein